MDPLPKNYTLAVHMIKADIKEFMGLYGLYFVFTLFFLYVFFRLFRIYKYA